MRALFRFNHYIIRLPVQDPSTPQTILNEDARIDRLRSALLCALRRSQWLDASVDLDCSAEQATVSERIMSVPVRQIRAVRASAVRVRRSVAWLSPTDSPPPAFLIDCAMSQPSPSSPF